MFSRSIVFILLFVAGVEGRDGFVKDQNVNLVEFPPKVASFYFSNKSSMHEHYFNSF